MATQEFPFDTASAKVPELVSQVPFFDGLDSGTHEAILNHTSVLECSAGDVVVREGEDDRCLIFLVRGSTEICKDGEVIATASVTGELLGELSILNAEPHSASVVATSDAFFLKTRPAFIGSLSRHERASYEATFFKYIANLLARRLATCSEKLAAAEHRLTRPGPA